MHQATSAVEFLCSINSLMMCVGQLVALNSTSTIILQTSTAASGSGPPSPQRCCRPEPPPVPWSEMAARHPNAFPRVDPTLWLCRSSSSAGNGRIFFICGRGTAGLSACEKVEGSILGFAVLEVSGYKNWLDSKIWQSGLKIPRSPRLSGRLKHP